MYADDVKLIEQGKFDFNKVELKYNPNGESIYCKQPARLSAFERLKLAVGNINEVLEVRFRHTDDEIPDPELIPQMIYDFELRKIATLTEGLKKLGCGELSEDIAIAFVVEIFPVDICILLFDDEYFDDLYPFAASVLFSVIPFLGELCTEEVYMLYRYAPTLECEEGFFNWKVFEYLEDNLFIEYEGELDREACIEEFNNDVAAANGVYARMYIDFVKDSDPAIYNKLVETKMVQRICFIKQLAVERYIKEAVEKLKSENTEYLEAEKRGDWWKTVTLAESQRVFAESFAIRFYVYGVYSD
jgi:hypothetical protein